MQGKDVETFSSNLLLGRLGQPEEIELSFVFLACDAWSSIPAANIEHPGIGRNESGKPIAEDPNAPLVHVSAMDRFNQTHFSVPPRNTDEGTSELKAKTDCNESSLRQSQIALHSA